MIELNGIEFYYIATQKTSSWLTKLDVEYHIDDEVRDILSDYFFIPHSLKYLTNEYIVGCYEPIPLTLKKEYDVNRLFSKLKLILP